MSQKPVSAADSTVGMAKRTFRCQMRDGSKFVVIRADTVDQAVARYIAEYHGCDPQIVDDITAGEPEKRVLG